MCLLYDEDEYYFNIVKGILNLMDSKFEDSYKKHYSLCQYIDDKSRKNKYEANNIAFKNYCIAIVNDINRMLNEYELNKERYSDNSSQTNEKEFLNKISEDKFEFLIKKSRIEYDDVLSNIFKISNNNDDILLKIKALSNNDKEKYFELKGYLEEYLEINAIKNNNIDLNQRIKSMEDKLKEQNDKLSSQDKAINSLELIVTEQKGNISELNTKIKNLSDDNAKIKEKLDFMETIINASL